MLAKDTDIARVKSI